MLLSVIVPVFNMEKFLPRCLDSLLRQGMDVGEDDSAPDFEIVCVDDGSTDRSPAILADYAERYPRLFRIIRQENQGLGPARNAGMAVARGEYIGFVDSDDYLTDGGLGYVCEHFLEGTPDVVTYACRTLQSEAEEPKEKQPRPDGKVTLEGNGRDLYTRMRPVAVWTRFYKRSFLQEHDVKFEPIFMEDDIFNLCVFRLNPTVRVVDSNIYRYMKDNADSITCTREKSKVLQKLDDCVYSMGVFNSSFISEGRESVMAAGIKSKIDNSLEVFYRELYRVHLTFKEWSHVTKKKNNLPIHSFSYRTEPTMLAKQVAIMKNLSGRYYLAYLVFRFIHRTIFEKYLKKRIAG
jgi:glycosyltransferase involved in cell wall biosynthesis